MTVVPKPRALDWFALAIDGVHPVKVAILETLAEGGNAPMSPNMLAATARVRAVTPAPGVNLGVTSYHVRQLAGKGLLVLESTEPRRGALEHFYVLAESALLSPRQSTVRAMQRSMTRMAGREVEWTPENLARAFHETYERLAPEHGYKTREASAVPWRDVPSANKKLMIHVSTELLRGVAGA